MWNPFKGKTNDQTPNNPPAGFTFGREVPPELAAMLQAMAESAVPVEPPSVQKIVEMIGEQNPSRVERVWATEQQYDCCSGNRRNGVIVMALTPDWQEQIRTEVGDPKRIPVAIGVLDHHTGDQTFINYDTEALKLHVNACMEAINYIESRRR